MSCCETGSSCKCPCHRVLGILVALFGATFLLGMFNVITPYIVSLTWPTLLVLAGLKLACAGACKCCKKD